MQRMCNTEYELLVHFKQGLFEVRYLVLSQKIVTCEIKVLFLAGMKELSRLKSIQTSFGTNLTSYLVQWRTQEFFSGGGFNKFS